jgi:hypothetical protein
MVLITDIAQAIITGSTNSELNSLIGLFIDSEDQTVINDWRIANYIDLRRWNYLPTTVYNDAQVKINSGDSSVREEGTIQLSNYYSNCLTVKARFPKE